MNWLTIDVSAVLFGVGYVRTDDNVYIHKVFANRNDAESFCGKYNEELLACRDLQKLGQADVIIGDLKALFGVKE